jgi:site-specific DNA-methyltransferase (adenine-specific)
MSKIRLLCGDALNELRVLAANSIDAVVTDPPYGLDFMGKDWDHGIPGKLFWRMALRVAKPGAHLLAFGGTRTFHRLTCAIEDAGWEIRDCLMWVYGSGFPKSLDVSKAIDKAAGIERPRVAGGVGSCNTESLGKFRPGEAISGEAISGEAIKWQGWGTGLKPAWEPIILARKPLEGTVAENVQKWGTGALNIDGCRVSAGNFEPKDRVGAAKLMEDRPWQQQQREEGRPRIVEGNSLGRWPANLIHDGSEEVVGMFPQSDTARIEKPSACSVEGSTSFEGMRGNRPARGYNEQGSAARFFYCAKASKEDRGEGNNHPTVKPVALMRYLCRLVTPPGGTVLDPFMGSGSTGKAAILEGFGFIGIDNVPEYVEIARRRIDGTAPLFAEVAP